MIVQRRLVLLPLLSNLFQDNLLASVLVLELDPEARWVSQSDTWPTRERRTKYEYYTESTDVTSRYQWNAYATWIHECMVP